ncbi:hypothetical protein DMENIID0001_047500 [Sergentomyia squamirostris]
MFKVILIILVIVPNLCSAEVLVLVLRDPKSHDYYLDFSYLYVPEGFIQDLPTGLTPPRKPSGRTFSQINSIVNKQFAGRRPLAPVVAQKLPYEQDPNKLI